MTGEELRMWQKSMHYTYDSASVALGVCRRAYANYLKLEVLPKPIELACAALSAGINEWSIDD